MVCKKQEGSIAPKTLLNELDLKDFINSCKKESFMFIYKIFIGFDTLLLSTQRYVIRCLFISL